MTETCNTDGREVIAFTAAKNTEGKKDATGAFIPEARKFKKANGGRLYMVDNTTSQQNRRKSVYRNLEAVESPIGYLAFFCHGWRTGIQFGFRLQHLTYLAKHLAPIAHKDIVIALYCCSTAQGNDVGGDGGFADELRDQLCMRGLVDCKVVAHSTKGHTTTNPYVRIFDGGGESLGGIGGHYLIDPKSALWKPWKQALREDTDFRFKFPLQSNREIRETLGGGN